jgi:hypothetical protein
MLHSRYTDVDVRADQQVPGTGTFAVSNVTYATTSGNVPPAP